MYRKGIWSTDGDRAEDVLANAPESEMGFYTVPKVME
jgi:Asp-tRNA(Asn)/Glu-tRNA(Gln) amidotransferase C subunit